MRFRGGKTGARPARAPGRIVVVLTLIIVPIAELHATDKEVPSARPPALTQHDVMPITLRHCAACHGRTRQEAGLDLRSRAGMLRGGKSGPAIVPGQPERSLLIQKIRAGAMPPPQRLVEA